jgi:hypothetical protein
MIKRSLSISACASVKLARSLASADVSECSATMKVRGERQSG